MTVGELIEALSRYPMDMQVRVPKVVETDDSGETRDVALVEETAYPGGDDGLNAGEIGTPILLIDGLLDPEEIEERIKKNDELIRSIMCPSERR